MNTGPSKETRALVDATTGQPIRTFDQHPIAATIQALGRQAHNDTTLPTSLRAALIDLPAELCIDCGGDGWVWSSDSHGPDQQECPNQHCQGGIDMRGVR